jgi:uncharacterized repeat protein (TIGR01451 family)
VWNDTDGDGGQDAGEPGIPGVTVTLTGTTSSGTPVTLTTVTNGSGNYTFTDLATGTYKLTFSTVPCYKPTVQDADPDESLDSDVDPSTYTTPNEVLSVEEINLSYDVGFVVDEMNYGNFVWHDLNGNGQQNANEPGIPAVSVTLTGSTTDNQPVSLATITDNTGKYSFGNIQPGAYKLRFGPTGSYVATAKDTGSDATDSDVHTNTLETDSVALQGICDHTRDAGFYEYAKLGSHVWEDVNLDGLRNAGEPGLAAVSIELTGTTGDGKPISQATVSDATGAFLFDGLPPGSYRLRFTAPVGYAFTINAGDSKANPQTGYTPIEILVSGEANLLYNAGLYDEDATFIIYGTVKYDKNENCAEDFGDNAVPDQIVSASNGINTYYGKSDENGRYRILTPSNSVSYTVKSEIAAGQIGACNNDVPLTPVPLQDSAKVDFLIQYYCVNVEVSVSAPMLRRCFPSNGCLISYQNTSPVAVDDAYIILTLDPLFSIISSAIAYTPLNTDQYRFDVGDLPPFGAGSIQLYLQVSCAAVLGQTLCMEAAFFPPGDCLPEDPNWSGALLSLDSECSPDSLYFKVKNIGTGSMAEALEYIIIEDGVMGLKQFRPPLGAGDSIKVSVPANGKAWRIEVNQASLAPTLSKPSLTVEACTTGPEFSKGFVNQFPLDDDDPGIDIVCTVVTGSFDPNDKQGYPLGYGNQHYIAPGTEIEYLIRFQNTGTDTAFTVVVRDTLSPHLDPASIQSVAASHPFRYDLQGTNELVFTFDNILLPDSNINGSASNGFVRFRIRHLESVSLNTDIFNRAGIYFDYNDPVMTNTSAHRIGMDFIPIGTKSPVQTRWEVEATPNPCHEQLLLAVQGPSAAREYYLRVYQANGCLQWEQNASSATFKINTREWPPGTYGFHIFADGKWIGSGKVLRE